MKILVIGDSCTDVHIYGTADRLCPDAPVPILIPNKTVESGGMASNVYANILSLGVECNLITNTERVVKTRYVDEKTNQMIVRVDTGEFGLTECSNNSIYSKKDGGEVDYEEYDAVIISDYNKGFLTYRHIEYISTQHPLTFLDTKKIISPQFDKITFFKINQHEYAKNVESWKATSSFPTNIEPRLIVTHAGDGCIYNGTWYTVDVVSIKDNSGAGDSFLAGLVVDYIKTNDIKKSIVFANKCATIAVQQRGITTVGEFLQ